MAAEDLRKRVGKTQVEKQILASQGNRSHLHDEGPSGWAGAWNAIKSGPPRPERRFYFVISPASIVSTPEELQQLARMTATPRAIDTTYTGFWGGDPPASQMQEDGTPQEVKVGVVTWEEREEILGKTDCDKMYVVINGDSRAAYLVTGFNNVDAK